MKAFTDLRKTQPQILRAFSDAIKDVRIYLPTRTEPPYDIAVVFLTERSELTREQDSAIETVQRAVISAGDVKVVLVDPEVRLVDPESMSLAEYFATRPLYLEDITHYGVESGGAEPPPRV